MARKKRYYSDEFRASALATLTANGGNITRTARDLGIPFATLQDWKNGRVHAEANANSVAKRKPLAELFEEIAYKSLGVLPGKLRKASASQLIIVAGTATDKMRLLREQATGIQGATDGLTDEKRYAAIVALLARYSQGGPRQIVDGTSNGAGPAVEPNGSAHEGGHNPGSVAG